MYEIKRKLIHVSSVFFVWFYWSFTNMFPIIVYTSLLLAFRFETMRLHLGRLLVFDDLLRKDERKRLAGYFYLLLGLTILTTFTSDPMIISSGILIAAVSDTLAALIGVYLGKHKIYPMGKQRSIEGTIAGIVSTAIVAFYFFPITVAFITTLLYRLNDRFRPGDDNLSNPLIPLVAWKLLLL